MQDFYELLTTVRDRGFLVNNLFQRDDGTWQASLRSEDLGYEFGMGSTPREALSNALNATQKAGKPLLKNIQRIVKTHSRSRIMQRLEKITDAAQNVVLNAEKVLDPRSGYMTDAYLVPLEDIELLKNILMGVEEE